MTATLLELQDVGKRYKKYRSNLSLVAAWMGLPINHVDEFWALRNFSTTLRAGEALAVVGQNGAGKSSLLKLVTGTVRPSTGMIWIGGQMASIIELGLGFSPELTGRQNVFLAAGMRGLSRDAVSELMPQIEAFAELHDFFDEPLRVYSSGMQARLAFSLVTATRPDLLVIDEILSVGDAYFQHKSFQRIRAFKDAGSAILLVTHNMADVRALCDRAILLDHGRTVREGLPDEIIDLYNAKLAERSAASLSIEQRRQKNGWSLTRSGTLEATVVIAQLRDASSGDAIEVVRVGQPIVVRLVVKAHQDISSLVLGCMIRDRTGHIVWGSNTWHTEQPVSSLQAGEEVEFRLHVRCDLGPGSYSVTHALTVGPHHALGNYEWIDNSLVFEVVNSDHRHFVGTSHLDVNFEIKRSTVWTRQIALP